MIYLTRLLVFVFLLFIIPAQLTNPFGGISAVVVAKSSNTTISLISNNDNERKVGLRSGINNLAQSIKSKMKIKLPRNPFRKRNIKPFPAHNQGSRGPLILARAVSWILINTVRSKLLHSKGIKIDVESHSNKRIAKGEFSAIRMTFDSIQHSQLRVSGGGSFSIEGLEFRLHHFLFINRQAIAQPYKISCDLNLTPEDVVNSPYIRLLFQSAVDTGLVRILNSGVINVTVHSVAMKEQRLYARGSVTLLADGNYYNPITNAIVSAVTGRATAATVLNSNLNSNSNKYSSGYPSPRTINANVNNNDNTNLNGNSNAYGDNSDLPGTMNLNFEISTCIGVMADKTNVLYLKDLAVVLNPDSLLLRTNLPIPTSDIIEINLGALSEVHRLSVGDGKLAFAASVVVSPSRSLNITDNVEDISSAHVDSETMSLFDTIESIAVAAIDTTSAITTIGMEQLAATASVVYNSLYNSVFSPAWGWYYTDTQNCDSVEGIVNPSDFAILTADEQTRSRTCGVGEGRISQCTTNTDTYGNTAASSSSSSISSSSNINSWFWSNTVYHYDLSGVLSEMLQINGGWLTSRLPIWRILRAQKYE